MPRPSVGHDSHQLTKGEPDSGSERVDFHHQLHQLFLEMGLAFEAAQLDETARSQLAAEMRTRLLAFAQQPWQDPDCPRLARRIQKHLDELLVWRHHPAVAADNHEAERELRPAVVTRKTSFGSLSKQGAHAFARLLSLIRTWERQDQDFFEVAQQSIRDHILSEN